MASIIEANKRRRRLLCLSINSGRLSESALLINELNGSLCKNPVIRI